MKRTFWSNENSDFDTIKKSMINMIVVINARKNINDEDFHWFELFTESDPA